jgi:tRNA pseudouridine13 synthase
MERTHVSLPYLTTELPGIGGRIKMRPEDFRVDEQPLYPASGEGTHVYARIRKLGIPTPVAVERIARHMNVKPMDVGFAGLKDAQALATQWLSIEHVDADKLAAFSDGQMQVVEVTHHTNKLRPGHLAGNRFAIRIREAAAEPLPMVQAILDVLVRRGVPNYFGKQRFGMRGDTDALGAALVRDDLAEFVAVYLGRPVPEDSTDCRAAREAFDAGDLAEALRRWPRNFGNERKALSAFKQKGRPAAAVAAIDKRMKRLFVSACQSRIFNRVVAARIESIDCVLVGDQAQKTDSGGVFLVEDLQAEQPRAAAGEISATGPIPGQRARLAEGEPGRIEREAIAASSLSLEDLDRVGRLKLKGSRRPLRFLLGEPIASSGEDEHGPFVEMQFTAPSGCYATVAVREIMKTDDL